MSTKVNRSKYTKKLNSLPILKRNYLREIVRGFWYIVYEGYLIKPKLLKYNFVDEYHAKKFADEYLQGYRYNILQGEILLSFGFTSVDYRLSQVAPVEKGNEYRYGFHPELSSQRKKALRTAYRRTYRRRLQKLLKIKKTMNKVPITLNKINDKPGVFFKKLKALYLDELTYSSVFPEWYINEEGWRIDEIKQYAKDIPNTVTDVVNIVRTLEDKYNDNNYDYKNDTYVSLAIKLHKKYKERIERYMKKKLGIGTKAQPLNHTKVEAWRELIARGFIDNLLLDKPLIHKKDCFIRGNVGNLVWDQRFKDQQEAYPVFMGYGVKGFTGISDPNAK